MEDLTATEMILKLKIATLIPAQLTEGGPTFLIGLNALLHAMEVFKSEAKLAATLLRQTEELTATEMILKPRSAIPTLVQVR